MAMIQDPELRQLFQMECEEHLLKLEKGLLHLEHHPDDGQMLEELQREFHNIKGSSRMLGIGDMENVAHCMEDALKVIGRGELALTPERVDRLEWGLDILSTMANEALTGIPAKLSATEVVAALSVEALGALAGGHPGAVSSPDAQCAASQISQETGLSEPLAAMDVVAVISPSDIEPSLEQEYRAPDYAQEWPLEPAEAPVPTPFAAASETGQASGVKPGALDALKPKIGELAVTKAHVERWRTQVENLIELWHVMFHGGMAVTPDWVERLDWGLNSLRTMGNQGITYTPTEQAVIEALSEIEARVPAPAVPAGDTRRLPPEAPIPQAVVTDVAVAPMAEQTQPASFQPEHRQAQRRGAEVEEPAPFFQPERRQAERRAPEERLEADGAAFQIETIRVEPKKLDGLMIRAGELTVTRTHIERWLTQVESLIALWEEVVREVKKGAGSDAPTEYMDRMGAALYPLRQAAFEDSAALNRIAEGLGNDIRALRLLPMDRVFQLFPRTVRDLARSLAKEVQLVIQGGDTTADKHLIEMLKDPLMHLIRNAIHHGIETPGERQGQGKPAKASIRLNAHRTAEHILVEVADDGRGLDVDAIRQIAVKRKLFTREEVAAMPEQRLHGLIFTSGFSTSREVTDIAGRGVGLDVVRSTVERLKGSIRVESSAGQGCKFLITLPLTLATTRVFLITIAQRRYALPVEFVRVVRYVALDDVFLVQDQETISWQGEAIAMAWLEDLLELPRGRRGIQKVAGVIRKQPCLLLEINEERLGVFVDEIEEELEIVLKPAGPLLNRVRNVSGVTILGSGEVCVVLNPFDLLRSAQRRAHGKAAAMEANPQPETATGGEGRKGTKPVILLAEDSITTRTQEKRILETAGYEVVTAVDGLAAFNALGARSFDALVSDIEMPRMDGLTLASKVRENKAYEHLPIILISSLGSEEDRKRGLDVGADAYIAKSAFNQQVLLDTLSRMI